MRTLTLGVLIVSGGTLAALPFRRYQAIPDASSAPAQVTGPSQSALDSPLLDKAESDSPAVRTASDELPMDSDLLVGSQRHWAQQLVPREQRQIDIPLTYEDLAQPIDLPAAIEYRFNAIATVREKQLDRERATELVMPAMESLAVAQQEEPKRATAATNAESATESATAELATGRAGGTLASSTSSPEKKIERLPEVSPTDRERHWIRQPD